jgi:prophage regulatory protein
LLEVNSNIGSDRIIRKRELRQITGLSDTTIWRRIKAGKFPPSRNLSSSAVGWLESEVMAWMKGLPISEPASPGA